MPIYEAVCPVEVELYDDLYLRASQAPTDASGKVVLDCPFCGDGVQHPTIPSAPARLRVTGETTPGGFKVSGHTFDSFSEAQAWGEKQGMAVVDTGGAAFKQTRERHRNGLDRWLQSQGYSDRSDFRRRSGVERFDRAQAAQERQEKTGSTDSSGTSEKLRSLAAKLRTR